MKEILEHTIEYLKKTIPDFKKNRKEFTCPSCKADPPTCNFISDYHYIMACCKCGFQGDLTELINPDKDKALEQIRDFLGLKIKINPELDGLFSFYTDNAFDLVPVQKNGKAPIEKDWTNKNHKNPDEWKMWLERGLNLGVKTGKISNITVIDIDDPTLVEEIKTIFNPTTYQITNKGVHYFYKYEEDLPKTRIDKYKIDIENNGGQVVIAPSTVDGIERTIVVDKIATMSPELKEWLVKQGVKKPPRIDITEQETGENIDLSVIPEGGRHHILMKIGGVLRKELNTSQLTFSLGVLNQLACNPKLNKDEFNAIIQSLNKYDGFDEKDLAKTILKYLSIVEECTARDVKEALGFKKERIDKVLSYLLKEGYVVKKKRMYQIVRKAEWHDTWMEETNEVPYKLPYLYDVGKVRNGDLILIGGKSGTGKCYAKGTPILMYNGEFKFVETIKPNDKLMGIDSKPRKVIKIGNGRGKLFEIKPKKGTSFTVNFEHMLSLKKEGTNNTINISVKEFLTKNKTFQKQHKLYRVPINFKEKNVPLEPYFLGLWLGDGCSYSSGICNNDKEVQSYCKSYSKKLGLKFWFEKGKNGKADRFKITSGRGGKRDKYNLSTVLRKLNLLYNKHIPINYKINSRKKRLELLAGLLDSDGYLGQNTFYFSNKSEKLIDDVKYLASSLGFLVTKKPKFVSEKKYYRLSIIGDGSLIPTKIKRKKAKKRRKGWKNPLYTGFSIIPKNKDNYYGFETDGNHLHIVKEFIVNHNTHIAMNMIKEFKDQNIKPHYISLESGSRFAEIAKELCLIEGDFKWCTHFSPESIELEPNAVTILDWLLPRDYASTDKTYEHFAKQLVKQGGILIVFCQLRRDGSFFAEDMIKFFPSIIAKFLYSKEDDGEASKFEIVKVREPLDKRQGFVIPCFYDWQAKRLKRVPDKG